MSNIILAIDSSMDCCSVAIYKNQYIYSLSEMCKKKHTIKILPMIQKVLFQTKTKLQELNYVSFAKGPGNFTGIRIAASIAQSFSLSLQIPIISVSTLAIIAEKAWRKYKKKYIIFAVDAKKTEVYWAKYTRNSQNIWTGENTESLIKKKLIKDKISNLKNNWTLIGNGWESIEYKNFLNVNKFHYFLPNAQDIIPFVLLKIKNLKTSCSKDNDINYIYDHF
ncbi:tRNA (adenosine(37)-N6)-threonylcarbamoyltransferase complex dimerization subunit type 1 TsaB [Buchnera aphidicola (Hyperomyzus lactucae)]|uniref:tRNA threonylcarbamoyladenosine biosynthesis protein TsaB n=1 Tax=Buchnera aphidicola (Hyperomyzus lactucae) TaxID=1241860 RepID=A0A4D6Y3M8_9GAMM|nr:tRNA (adenosine(37)-N6)-threonylcarbamoyltransferase complex dimerization subunit type 1 TsaB [Buchnera aphidicola]QCI21048.1 tRNA (adenosine(37)-N6)-threonylcarbamoyltransferase complex dimerization subunit type 1 TsaB [Buchnera aphidicola (Hyperomyzus lactucae)]